MRLINLLVLLAFFSTPVLSQGAKWRMAIIVDNPDQDVAASVTIAITTELSSVKNLTLTKNGENLRVLVQMIPIEVDNPRAYATSAIILNKSQCVELAAWILISSNVN